MVMFLNKVSSIKIELTCISEQYQQLSQNHHQAFLSSLLTQFRSVNWSQTAVLMFTISKWFVPPMTTSHFSPICLFSSYILEESKQCFYCQRTDTHIILLHANSLDQWLHISNLCFQQYSIY